VSDFYSPAGLYDPNWFVLFVRSNQEKRIAQHLADRQIEHFLPCCRSLRQWKDRRVTLEMPLFPGYVFVRLPFIERSKVLTLPNVVSLVGNKNSPSVISEEEIAWIRRGVEHGNASPHPYLNIGQRVIITVGALAGMQGILVRKQNNTRVVVSLDSIARSFVVEVDLDSVAPLASETRDYKRAV
jgi:transcription antitermination factor NusG